MLSSLLSVDSSTVDSHLLVSSVVEHVLVKSIQVPNEQQQQSNIDVIVQSDSQSQSDFEIERICIDLIEESVYASGLDLDTVYSGVMFCNTDELVNHWKDWLIWLLNRLYAMEVNVEDMPVLQRCRYFEALNAVCWHGSQIAVIHRDILLSHAVGIQVLLMEQMKLCKSVTVLSSIMQV